jgi:ATP-binding cassette subfamily C protein
VTAAGRRLLFTALRGRRRTLTAIAGWSVLESLPALLTGALVAASLDRGFLDGRPLAGTAWLAPLLLAAVLRSWATSRLFPHLADLVEPLRDALVTAVVRAAVSRAAQGPAAGMPDTGAVARLTGHVETVRNLTGALVRGVRQLCVTLLMALAGVAVLSPLAGLLVACCLLPALLLLAVLVRRLAARHRALALAEERVAREGQSLLAGLRDIAACGAEPGAVRHGDAVVEAEARASRALALTGSLRLLAVALGGYLPVLLVLLAAPWLIRRGDLTPGQAVGVVAYLTTGLEPALRSLVGIVGSWGVQWAAVLDRLAEATALPPEASSGPPAGTAASPFPGSVRPPRLEARRITFSYGPHAQPVVDGLDLRLEAGEHLAVVGPSGIGKSTLSDLLAGITRPTRGGSCWTACRRTSAPAAARGASRSSPRRRTSSTALSATTCATWLPGPVTRNSSPPSTRSAADPSYGDWAASTPVSARTRPCRPANASSWSWRGSTRPAPTWSSSTRPPATSTPPPRRAWSAPSPGGADS